MEKVSQSNDYSDMLAALNGEGAEYLVVGAHAVAYHGRPRASKDLDVWVRPSPENAERVFRAAAKFGANMHGTSAGDFTDEDLIFQIGVEPVRIDIITAIDGVSFDTAWPRRREAAYAGVPVNVIDIEDLLANKRASGRKQDLADVAALERLRK